MKIALCQIQATKDAAANLHLLGDYTRAAVERGARLVIFPEASMISFGGSLYDAAAQHELRFRQTLGNLAREHRVTVVAGGFAPVELADEWELRVHNNLYAFDQNGVETVYSKIHLYDAFGFKESDTVKAGEQLKLITVDGVKIGLATCYDVRFPQLFADYSRAGAQATILAASWAGGEGKVEQWKVLTSARALDANMFVLAVDQASPAMADPRADVTQPTGIGFSRAISPFGRVLVEAGEAPEILIADLDITEVAEAKKKLPVLVHPRVGH
ncbi:MAG: nitrilase-related carbon-nitrogen hydrolase [Rothia sp. (in: high G+C Gram-positive bacteria)]|nr:nitrilase-related carbon-nitrogen hydrolase [Rothia sp. (in: high G+C Gram-positive bacteria)]